MAHIEMTVRIDDDAHPLLYQYLAARRQGKPRAAAFKRLAENSLLLAGEPVSTTHHVTPNANANACLAETRVEQPATENSAALSGVKASDVRSSLAQFMPGGRR